MHHDDALGRLTEGNGRLATLTAAALKRVPSRTTTDRMHDARRIMRSGRRPHDHADRAQKRFDGDRRLAARVAQVLASYRRAGRA